MIANTLFLSKDIEKWGSGIKRIYEACKQSGTKVNFEKTSTGFKVIFFRPEDFGRLSGQLSGQLSGPLKDVQSLIKKKPGILAKDISLELKRPYRTVIKQIYKLEDLGLIERIGSKKTGGYHAKMHGND